jgi:hypothetical protein
LGGTVAPLSSWLKSISLIFKKDKEVKYFCALKKIALFKWKNWFLCFLILTTKHPLMKKCQISPYSNALSIIW